jgi:hypothetical protein
MTISPNISALINLLGAIVSVVVSGAAEWTTLFGSGPGATIVAVAGIISTVLTGINSFLHGVSAPVAGKLAARQH